MPDAYGPNARFKLTLSYAGFVMVAGVLLLAAVWVFLLRYVPDQLIIDPARTTDTGVFPTRSNLLRVFAPRAAAVMAFLLVFGLVGGWFLAGRMLAPLDRITQATRLAATGSLAHRIGPTGRRDEFGELAGAFDAMLDQLETHVASQQRFAANASHELRTPLAITQTLLDVARSDPDRLTPELVEQLRSVNLRATALTESLLVLSRVDRHTLVTAPVDLSLVAEEATEELLALAGERGVTVRTACDPAPMLGSAALLHQMSVNLVRNAIVHNRRGGTATIITSQRPGGLQLAVENTGAVLPPEILATLAEPFVRGSARARTDAGDDGVGLGLAIVRSIAEAHGGRLELDAPKSGGLVATVTLPAEATPRADDRSAS